MKQNNAKHTEKKQTISMYDKTNDIVAIKKHLSSIDNDEIKKALIANGIYDSNMRLTPSFR